MKMVRHGTSTPSQMLRRCHDVSSSSSIVIIVIKREPNTSYALMENAQGTTVKSINSLFEFLADCSHEASTPRTWLVAIDSSISNASPQGRHTSNGYQPRTHQTYYKISAYYYQPLEFVVRQRADK